jgi:SAM-dependent methyltransferase
MHDTASVEDLYTSALTARVFVMADTTWIAEAAESYDRVAVPYADLVRDGLRNLPLESSLLAHFAAQVGTVDGGGQVLDIGCGPGLLTRHLASFGVSVVGVDVSPGMLHLARKNNPGVEFIESSLTELPLPDASIGGVFCFYVMHHVPDHDLVRSFAEIARVLRPGGQVMLGGHVGDSTYVKSEGYGGLPMNVLVAKRSPETYADLLCNAGLSVDATVVHGPDKPATGAVWLGHKPT